MVLWAKTSVPANVSGKKSCTTTNIRIKTIVALFASLVAPALY